MNEFIKKMLQLGAELEKTESPTQASMIINDAEILYRDEIKALTIPVVVVTLPSIDSKEFESYLIDNGYAKATKGMRLKGDKLFPVDNIYKHYTNVLEFGN